MPIFHLDTQSTFREQLEHPELRRLLIALGGTLIIFIVWGVIQLNRISQLVQTEEPAQHRYITEAEILAQFEAIKREDAKHQIPLDEAEVKKQSAAIAEQDAKREQVELSEEDIQNQFANIAAQDAKRQVLIVR